MNPLFCTILFQDGMVRVKMKFLLRSQLLQKVTPEICIDAVFNLDSDSIGIAGQYRGIL